MGSAGLVTTCPLMALCMVIAGLGFPLNFYTRSEKKPSENIVREVGEDRGLSGDPFNPCILQCV